ncbi:MAG: 16S rRNA (guanine(527)-N(7))-methyltransferase RsmG [Oscillospiraceae bacterium]|jgi:16S rRNA (guanine(527)-N(7))-methyltransferase RsmG|nr:16S rRNA (guanine(527)-N(7))-methyltransferase RsmG [Oscillospiraceae bacterium]
METFLQDRRLDVYAELLAEKSLMYNLTAVPPSDYRELHFRDSLELLNAAEFEGRRVIDVGSGAGFPGVPLKLAVPSIELTALDATKKRSEFLRLLSKKLGVGYEVIWARAEDAGAQAEHRESYDIAVSRAVASLPQLAEMCLPFVKPGGVFLAPKGNEIEAELENAREIITKLGGKIRETRPYFRGNIVVIDKISATPEVYPRKWKKIVNGKT